jgi:hypothetical protein
METSLSLVTNRLFCVAAIYPLMFKIYSNMTIAHCINTLHNYTELFIINVFHVVVGYGFAAHNA